MKYKTLLIYNPTAGPWDMTRTLKRLAEYLHTSGWQTELVQTQQPGDATRYARQAAQDDMDIVLVAGGDGTINEVVNGLAGTATTLGIVPVGTGNILAHQLRMPILSLTAPLYVRDVGEALCGGRVQRVDVGITNERYFVCWAGLGLDAEITVHIEPRPRYAKRLRTLSYIIAGFAVASEFRGVRSRIVIEGRTFRTRALMALASNIQLYAAFFNIAPHARMDDGLLDIFVFKGLGFSYILRHLLHLFSGTYRHDPKVMHALARTMQVQTVPPVAVHLDGDPFGDTPATIGIEPGKLRLLIPPQAPANLFSKPPEQILG
ncbi:MAG TPA: diacylglycerol kinase family lipid kinase [Anaerolineae bacterium]|nr:diacylglycerol kinase family lipid kinase [Anaerolineae bacterium]HQK13329.1 diacylglycerol kinase family lipid kinase [Anaerolineae bacterium]